MGEQGRGNRFVPMADRAPAAIQAPLLALLARLHAMADRHLRREGSRLALQPADLVSEVYLRLTAQRIDWRNRAQLLAVASRLMRRVLIDRARRRSAVRRGGGLAAITLTDSVSGLREPKHVDLLDLDRALFELRGHHPRQERVVELRYFAGLSIEETARAMGISTATVKREWRMARGWLYARLK